MTADAAADILIAVCSLLLAGVVGVFFLQTKVRERVAKLEEWVRLHNGKG